MVHKSMKMVKNENETIKCMKTKHNFTVVCTTMQGMFIVFAMESFAIPLTEAIFNLIHNNEIR